MTPDGQGLRQAAFLDRDGVVNRAIVRDGKPFSPVSPDEFVVIPGIPEACARLRSLGLVIVVVTNQPDIARGLQTADGVAAIHARLRSEIEVDAIYLCPHDNDDGCSCRKPKPGMLLSAAQDLSLDLNRSFMVGDRWSDIAAGQAAGCRTVHVDHGYLEERPVTPDQVVADPVSALDWIWHELQAEQDGVVRAESRRSPT